MKKVLIIFQTPKKRRLYANTIPPLGMLYIASYLESKGIHTDVIDCHVQKLRTDFSQYSTILFSVNISNIENTIDTIRLVKEKSPNSKIIVGGPMTTNRGKYYLNFPEIDAVVIGEGEITAYEYLTSKDIKKVKGLLLRDNKGKIVFTGERPLIFNLDELPFPALNKIPLNKYYIAIKKASPISSIVTSRGCPGKCIFCFHSPIWRQRSAKNVVDEIEWQVNKLGVKEITINDNNFTQNRQRVFDICQDIINRGIKVRWQCKSGVRVDKLDKKLLAKMKESGMWLIGIAPETGNKESLIKIKKGFTLDDVEKVVKWARELEIVTMSNFSVGYPWETKKHLNDTLKFSIKLDPDFVKISRIIPIEGTPLYDIISIKPKKEFKDEGIFYGSMKHNSLIVSQNEMHNFIRKFYIFNYLNPKKILRIIRILSIKDILYLVGYSLISKSI